MSTTTANAGKVMQHLEHCAAGAVAGARRADRVRHRAMGAVSPLPGRTRAICCERLLGERLTYRARRFPIWPAREVLLARHAGRGCFAFPSPASLPTSSRCRRAMATRPSAPSWARARSGASSPYGTEALGVMRIEKGHVAGNELNGTTTAPISVLVG